MPYEMFGTAPWRGAESVSDLDGTVSRSRNALRGRLPSPRRAATPLFGRADALARDSSGHCTGDANLRRPERRQINRRSQGRLNRADRQRRRQTGLSHGRIRIDHLRTHHSAHGGHLDRIRLGSDQRPDREQTMRRRKGLRNDRSRHRVDARDRAWDRAAVDRRVYSREGRVQRRMYWRPLRERVGTPTERAAPWGDSGADLSRRTRDHTRRTRDRRLKGVWAWPDHRIRDRKRAAHIWVRHVRNRRVDCSNTYPRAILGGTICEWRKRSGDVHSREHKKSLLSCMSVSKTSVDKCQEALLRSRARNTPPLLTSPNYYRSEIRL